MTPDVTSAASAAPSSSSSTALSSSARRARPTHSPPPPPPPPRLQLPVFFFHGVLQDASAGASFAAKMRAAGRRFEPLTFASGPVASIRSLRVQVPLAIAQIREVVGRDPDAFADGYVFVGYSQGGAIARAVVESMDDHNVRTLVVLAGVVNGMFFGPQPQDADALRVFLRELGPALLPPSVFDFARYGAALEPVVDGGVVESRCSGCGSSRRGDGYGSRSSSTTTTTTTSNSSSNNNNSSNARSDAATGDGASHAALAQRLGADFHAFALAHPELQQRYSYLNIARSPVADAWTKTNAFLAELNNVGECATPADAERRARRRANFLRLRAAHFFASPDDGLLSPWQTSVLGQYSEVAALETAFDELRVLDARETREYLDDTYGLRTLDARGGLGLHVLPNVPHDNWITDDVAVAGSRGFSAIFDEHLRPIL